MKRHSLLVSPYFPPSTLAGVHRARHLAKHLPSHGWHCTVVCVDPQHHAELMDNDLAKLVPSGTPIVSVGAVPASVTRVFGLVGDIGLRGLGHIGAAIARLLEHKNVDLVMITGSPYYPMLLASWIRRRWKVPVLLDFQDPWVTDQQPAARPFTKAWVARHLAIDLEPRVLRAASFITAVSDRQNADLANRYPWLDRTRMAGIPIGGDLDDFGVRRSTESTASHVPCRELSFSYIGTIWQAALPVVEALLLAVRRLRDTHPQLYNRLRFKFVGTSALARPTRELKIIPMAARLGIEKNFCEIPERRPYLEAIGLMAGTHAGLLLGSLEPHYTASKVFPILMAGRPYLSILHHASSANELLARAGGGVAITFSGLADLHRLVPTIAMAIVRLTECAESIEPVDPVSYQHYTANAIAGRFAEIFDRLAGERVGAMSSVPE